MSFLLLAVVISTASEPTVDPGSSVNHSEIDTSEETPRSHWLEHDILHPAGRLLDELHKEVLSPIGLTFEPSAGWTYQHATKVREGYPSSRSTIWYSMEGDWTVWSEDGTAGKVVYSASGNTGLGDSTYPYMGEALGNPDYLNNILVPNRFGLQILYWEQTLFDEALTVRVGKYEDQYFFDQNVIAYDPVTGFLAENFNEQIVMPFPNYAFGANVEWRLEDDVIIRVGTMNSANPGNNSGFEGLTSSHLFTTAELDLTVRPMIGEERQTGHWRLTPWYNAIQNPFGPDQVTGWGVCLNMDQQICENLTIFGRLGWGENRVTRSNFAVSTGIAIDDPLGLKHHHIGLAFEYAKITAIGRQQVGLPPVPGEQYLMEFYWLMDVSETISLGPVVQILRDTVADIDTSVIWGFRASWSY